MPLACHFSQLSFHFYGSGPPHTHTWHQRCAWLCSCVPAEHHLLLLCGLTHQHWRKKVNHSSPSLLFSSPSDYMDFIYLYKKKIALNPVHQLTIVLSVCEHWGPSVQKFWWFEGLICAQWPPCKEERDRRSNKHPGHESGEKRNSVLGKHRDIPELQLPELQLPAQWRQS